TNTHDSSAARVAQQANSLTASQLPSTARTRHRVTSLHSHDESPARALTIATAIVDDANSLREFRNPTRANGVEHPTTQQMFSADPRVASSRARGWAVTIQQVLRSVGQATFGSFEVSARDCVQTRLGRRELERYRNSYGCRLGQQLSFSQDT